MGAGWTKTTRSRTIVVAVTIRAVDLTVFIQRRINQARHIVILPRPLHWMKRRVCHVEFKSGVYLCYLPVDVHKRKDVVVSMAFETDLVREIRLIDLQPGGTDPRDTKLSP